MKIWILRVAMLVLLGLTASAHASPPSYFPSYLLLRPSGDSHRASRHQAYPAYGIPVQSPGYSYGYFGAEPRRHRDIHRGYYGNYFEVAPR